MTRRLKALVVAACAGGVLPVSAPPAEAFVLFAGCQYTAARDVTGSGWETWIGVTTSVFVGTPDTTSWEITCWLQTQPNHDPGGVSEVWTTRHTCSDTLPVGVCTNPIVFTKYWNESLYMCQHLYWTGWNDPTTVPNDLFDHLLRDVFSTGGITTMGGAAQIQATVVLAVTNLIATLTGTGLLDFQVSAHTETTDYDGNVPGIQCNFVGGDDVIVT